MGGIIYMHTLFFYLFPLISGCSTDKVDEDANKVTYVTEGTRSDCDPLDPALCAFPFPSSFYEATQPFGMKKTAIHLSLRL